MAKNTDNVADFKIDIINKLTRELEKSERIIEIYENSIVEEISKLKTLKYAINTIKYTEPTKQGPEIISHIDLDNTVTTEIGDKTYFSNNKIKP